MPRFVLAATVVAIGLGLVRADTFMAKLTRVEGNKVTYKKTTFHRDDRKMSYEAPVTVEITKDAAITWAHFSPADGPTTSEGRINAPKVAVEGALNNGFFKAINKGK